MRLPPVDCRRIRTVGAFDAVEVPPTGFLASSITPAVSRRRDRDKRPTDGLICAHLTRPQLAVVLATPTNAARLSMTWRFSEDMSSSLELRHVLCGRDIRPRTCTIVADQVFSAHGVHGRCHYAANLALPDASCTCKAVPCKTPTAVTSEVLSTLSVLRRAVNSALISTAVA